MTDFGHSSVPRFVLDQIPWGDDQAMVLRDHNEPKQAPLIVDFNNTKLQYRVRQGASGELIVKAVGAKQSERGGLLVFDFTSGLGTDSFLLASAGFRVVGFERDERLFSLLQDGLKRWRGVSPRPRHLSQDIEFVHGDVLDFDKKDWQKRYGRPYAIVLDPMFEDLALHGKSRPKKEMASLRSLLPPQTEPELQRMLECALSLATNRVVVKRPLLAAPLAAGQRGLSPQGRVDGKSARYDIYSCR